MLRLSAHARQRMKERDIDLADVTAVIDHPDVTFADRKGNPCYIREVDGRRVRVVVDAVDTDFVITAIDLDA
jgi:hypothetical protein